MHALSSLTRPDAREERPSDDTPLQEPRLRTGADLRYLFAIPVVNRPDLLARALHSVPALWPRAVIVDNTANGLESADWPVRVDRPSVPHRPVSGLKTDRKITRLNSSHSQNSYAVLCLKKKTTNPFDDDKLREECGVFGIW